jgi:hypothetical protein
MARRSVWGALTLMSPRSQSPNNPISFYSEIDMQPEPRRPEDPISMPPPKPAPDIKEPPPSRTAEIQTPTRRTPPTQR